MHKFSTALAVWAIFIFISGVMFPIELTNGASDVTQVLHSYTIYGFFSLIPIVFFMVDSYLLWQIGLPNIILVSAKQCR